MSWINGLTGLTAGALITIIIIVVLTNIPNIIKLIGFISNRVKIEIDEVRIYKIKAGLVLKTMLRCKDLLMSVTPDGKNSDLPEFNKKQRWQWDLVLRSAFMDDCRKYATSIAIEKDWVKMSPAQFAEICQNEPKWIMDSVTQACIKLYENEYFPVTFKELSTHNFKLVGAKCGEYIIEHFTELRNIRGGIV